MPSGTPLGTDVVPSTDRLGDHESARCERISSREVGDRSDLAVGPELSALPERQPAEPRSRSFVGSREALPDDEAARSERLQRRRRVAGVPRIGACSRAAAGDRTSWPSRRPRSLQRARRTDQPDDSVFIFGENNLSFEADPYAIAAASVGRRSNGFRTPAPKSWAPISPWASRTMVALRVSRIRTIGLFSTDSNRTATRRPRRSRRTPIARSKRSPTRSMARLRSSTNPAPPVAPIAELGNPRQPTRSSRSYTTASMDLMASMRSTGRRIMSPVRAGVRASRNRPMTFEPVAIETPS